jgi:hypothetical protein
MRSLAREERPALDRWGAWILGAFLALLVCFPLLGKGYVLSYDMVFVPTPAVNAHGLGLDGSVPRAVPADFLVAVASRLLEPWLLQQVVLVGLLVAAAVGAWRLTPARTLLGAAASAIAYTWNPYFAERFAIGHWSLLVGYAVLPHLVCACLRLSRTGQRPALAVVAVLLGLGAFSAPTSGVLTGVLAVALVWALPGALRARLLVTAAALLFNAVWAVPGALASVTARLGEAQVAAFAARPDSPLGGLVSVLTFGGIWNRLVVSPSRESAASAVLTLALVVVSVAGVATLRRAWGNQCLLVVGGVGLLGLAIAGLSLSGTGRELTGSLVAHVPGAGLLRDAQKWLAWWALLVASAVGPGLERLVQSFARPHQLFLMACGMLAPILALPGLAAGVGGQLHRTAWPSDFSRAGAALNERAATGAALVLPWHAFRAWPWNDDRAVLDPWTRLLNREVVVRDDLELTSGVVPGESQRARSVSRVLATGGALPARLRELGIRYVVLDRTTAGSGPVDSRMLSVGRPVFTGSYVAVRDLGPVADVAAPPSDRSLLVAVDAAAFAVWLACLAATASGPASRLLRFVRRDSRRRRSS